MQQLIAAGSGVGRKGSLIRVNTVALGFAHAKS